MQQVEPVAKKLDPSVEVDRLPVTYQTTDYTPVISKVKAPSDNAPAVKEFRTAKTIKGPVTSKAITEAYEKASSVDPRVSPVMRFGARDHLGTRSVQRVVVKNGVWTSVGDFYTPPSRD